MPDLARLLPGAIRTASRVARHLPGTIGGMGVYFAARDRLSTGSRTEDWRRDVGALLALSERALASGRVDAALNWFDKALRLSYHPALHSAGRSPLVADPEGFLRPLRASSTGSTVLDRTPPAGAEPWREPPRQRGADDPIRLLVIAQENWTFIRPVIDALRATGRYDIRELEVEDLPPEQRPERGRILRARYDLVTTGARVPAPDRLAEAYEWADVAFVEWGHHVLTWVSMLDRLPRRLIGRYHRFEAFTPFPLLHDYTSIDRIVHVSPPVRHLVDAAAPGARGMDTRYVSNLLSRGLGEMSEAPRDRRTLVQVGWNREIKDVLFTLEMVERLRREDPRFRLQLVGPGLPGSPAEDGPYQHRVRRRLEDLGPEAVELLGVRRDIPEILARAGLVVSSSNGEGTHESVMEGLATGCPAVIRDWPDALGHGGAGSVYEAGWVVPDVDGAVRRVLDLQDPERYAAEASSARRWAVEQRHPDRVLAGYERALDPGTPGQ